MVFCLQRPVIATIASVCVFFVACSSSPNPTAAAATSVKPPKERKEAPDFSLKDSYGKTVRLSDYRGKVVLLNFWATWCGPCKIEIPWFNEFEQQNKDRGFAVLGISMDEEGWEVVKPFTTRLRVNYRVLMGDDLTAELYGGVASLPTSFLIDQEGKVASVHVGLVSKSDYENEIEEILAAPARSARGADVAGVPAAAVGAR